MELKKYCGPAKCTLTLLLAISVLSTTLLTGCSNNDAPFSSSDATGTASQGSSKAASAIRDMSVELAQPNAMGNTSGNIANGGYAVEQAGWLYYTGQHGIFRIESGSDDLSLAEEVCTGNSPRSLNISGKDLFFSDGEKLKHLDLETGNSETLCPMIYGGNIWLENGTLYYPMERKTSASSTEYQLMQRAADAPASEAGEPIYSGESRPTKLLGTSGDYFYFSAYNSDKSAQDVLGIELSTGSVRTIETDAWANATASGLNWHVSDFLIEDGQLYALYGSYLTNDSCIAVYDLAQQQLTRNFAHGEWPYCYGFNRFEGKFLVGMARNGLWNLTLGARGGIQVNSDVPSQICTAGGYIFYSLDLDQGGRLGENLHAVKGDGSCYQQIF